MNSTQRTAFNAECSSVISSQTRMLNGCCWMAGSVQITETHTPSTQTDANSSTDTDTRRNKWSPQVNRVGVSFSLSLFSTIKPWGWWRWWWWWCCDEGGCSRIEITRLRQLEKGGPFSSSTQWGIALAEAAYNDTHIHTAATADDDRDEQGYDQWCARKWLSASKASRRKHRSLAHPSLAMLCVVFSVYVCLYNCCSGGHIVWCLCVVEQHIPFSLFLLPLLSTLCRRTASPVLAVVLPALLLLLMQANFKAKKSESVCKWFSDEK